MEHAVALYHGSLASFFKNALACFLHYCCYCYIFLLLLIHILIASFLLCLLFIHSLLFNNFCFFLVNIMFTFCILFFAVLILLFCYNFFLYRTGIPLLLGFAKTSIIVFCCSCTILVHLICVVSFWSSWATFNLCMCEVSCLSQDVLASARLGGKCTTSMFKESLKRWYRHDWFSFFLFLFCCCCKV